MNDKQFTDELFRRMYDLGYRKAEVAKGSVFFYKCDILVEIWTPRVPVECTCFTDEPQCIDVAEYLGVVDWSKVAVDTPVLVRDFEGAKWEKRYFAFFKNGRVNTWCGGTTSWSSENITGTISWRHAKVVEV